MLRCSRLACLATLAVLGTSVPNVMGEPLKGRGQRSAERCPAGQSGTRTPVPILMYHVIAAPPPGTPYPDLWVAPRRFARQIRVLAAHGYHGVTLDQVWRHWRRCAPLPRKPVVVSFDDGFGSWNREAYPVLSRYGWLGTMNLALSHLNGVDVKPSWLRKLIRAGWELDSHSLTHPDLTTLGADALRHEVAGSRRRLQRLFGEPVNFFCYPGGRYDDRVIVAVREAGYVGATSTVSGLARPSSPFVLRRIRVNGSDGAAEVLRNIRNAS
jgi:peptidoglycan/xylan/chitin deacetylase (PgdA/CDA1 family)